jgi:multidrug efflux system outer membrane protein
MNKLIPLFAAALISACAVGPDYQRPVSELPADWGRPAAEVPDLDRWWLTFDDERLSAYIEQSFEHNNDLKVAVANVDAAAAVLKLNREDYLPNVNGSVEATRSRGSENGSFPLVTSPVTEYSAGLLVNYELDIWGRIRRANEAALADLSADTAVMFGVRSALAANVARSYFQALALSRQIELLERVYATRIDNQRLQKLRMDGGLISPYDYEQARSEAAAVAAQLPDLRARLRQTITALGVLRGASPRELFAEWQATPMADGTLLPEAPSVPMDLPSEMLQRRPDVHAAEQLLVAANARIGEATAGYFPRVSLSAFAGGVSTAFSTLFDSESESWEAGAGATLPLMDLRSTAANVDGAEARRDAAAALYAGTVQTAFQETLDALANVESNRDVLRAQDERVDALANARRVATARYEAGRIGYLEVLDIERQVRQVEQEQVGARLNLLQATVDLFRALGGGWSVPPS